MPRILRPNGNSLRAAAGAILLTLVVAQAVGSPSQVQYTFQVESSTIAVPTPTIVANPLRPTQFYFPYGKPRAYGFGDFNGDGLTDIVVASSYFDQAPERRLEIWLNGSGGRFRDGTAEVLRGTTVLTGNVNGILVGDFNEDGRPDIFLLDTGLELNQPLYPGHRLGLLLSQPDGTLAEASDHIASNEPAFNHTAALADINGDGHLDVVVTILGIAGVHEADGTVVYLGDGAGRFAPWTAGLPNEIAYLPWPSVDFDKSRQSQGCSVAADLDGDGRPDLVTGSYNFADRLTGVRSIRFHRQQDDGTFVETRRVEIPAAIRDIGYAAPVRSDANDGLGCAGLTAGDLGLGGRQDIVVLWEGWGKSYIEILRNDGDFTFTDVTVEAFGGYVTKGATGPQSNYRLLDVNGDGRLDIVARSFGENAATLTQGSFLYLNDGTGKFSPWLPQGASGPISTSQIATAATCDYCNFLPLVLDVDNDGRPDVVLVDIQTSLTAPPMQTAAVKLTTLLARSAFPTRPVVEYYHAAFDHYFITSIPDEIAKLDRGAFGGWARTGLEFRAYSSPALETPSVCRFFGATFGERSSHFYTNVDSECATVKGSRDWQFEGRVFHALLPDEAGRCGTDLVPVYRLYNDGQGGAPNHRYTTSAAARSSTAAKGWIPEGWGADAVAMCAPR